MRRGRQLAEAGYVVFAPSYRGEDGSEGDDDDNATETRDRVVVGRDDALGGQHIEDVFGTIDAVDRLRISMHGRGGYLYFLRF